MYKISCFSSFLSSEIDSDWRSTGNDSSLITFGVVLAYAGDSQVYISVVSLAVTKFLELCFHDFLLFLGFLGCTHDRMEIDWGASFKDVSNL